MLQAAMAMGAVVLYYGLLVRVADRKVLALMLRRLRVGALSAADVYAVVNIVVAGAFQVLVVVALVALLDLDVRRLLFAGWHPIHALLVPLLALAELSMAAMLASLCIVLIRSSSSRSRGRRLAQQSSGSQPAYADWRSMMQSGWLRSFTRSHELLPTSVSWLMFLVYLGFEELLFRGACLTAFGVWGHPAAIVLSSIAFVLVQAVGMPTAQHALFPVAGAVVMGPVHAYLAAQQTPLAFLIATHFAFFVVATGTGPAMERLSRGVDRVILPRGGFQ